MKIHGLVTLMALCLADTLFAQTGPAPASENFLPPAPRTSGEANLEPLPLQISPSAPTSPVDIEAELKQFRNELREFQMMREEVSRSAKAADADADRITLQQRQELVELLTKLANKSAKLQKAREVEPRMEADSPAAKPLPPNPQSESTPMPLLSETLNLETSTDLVDPFALGKVLFRAGDFAGAERAFRKATVDPENETTLKYLLATCVRRQSRWKEAVSIYKTVAESNQDPVLRDLAKWQLDNIRWVQESESQLNKLRQQREKQNKSTTGQSNEAAPGK